MPLQGAAVRVLCAFWSWVAGAAAGVPLQGAAARCCCQSAVCALEPGCWCTAGCCCRVPLLVLLRWQASPGAVQGAGLLFIFSLLVFRSKRALVGWYAFKPCLGIALASFWLRFFLLMLQLRWCCEPHKQHSRKSNAQAAAPAAASAANLLAHCSRCWCCLCAAGAACAAAGAACAAAGAACAASAASAACAACAACAASAAAAAPAASAAAAAAAGSDLRRVATLRPRGKSVYLLYL